MQAYEDRYTYNGKTFMKPTGLKMDTKNLPVLKNANSTDYAKLIKDFRNTIMHWPNQDMSQKDFDRFWKFFEDVLTAVGVNCAYLNDLKYGGYIMPDQFMNSFIQIMKECRNETGNTHVILFCPHPPAGSHGI